MKKALLILLVAAMMLMGLAACAPAADPPAADPPPAAEPPADPPPAAEPPPAADPPAEDVAEGGMIGISQMSPHPFFGSITEAMREIFEPAGFDVLAVSADYGAVEQIAHVEDFIARGVDAIMISPGDAMVLRTAFEQAHSAGIPLIVIDNPSDDHELIIANVATDNYLAGVQNAQQAIIDMGGEGKVLLLEMAGNTAVDLRMSGFRDYITENAPGIEIVGTLDYSGMADAAMAAVEDTLMVHPDLRAVFAGNEQGAFGAISAALGQGLTPGEDLLVYSVDGSAEAIGLIIAGQMAGTAAQQTRVMGEVAARMMLEVLAGNLAHDDYWVPPLMLTAENAHTFDPVF